MRTLFAFLFLALVTSAELAAQVIPRPSIPKRPPQPTNTYLVTFRRDTTLAQRSALVQSSGATIRMNYRTVNAASVEIPDATALDRLRNDPRVLSVFVNRPISLSGVQGRGSGPLGHKTPTSLSATATS